MIATNFQMARHCTVRDIKGHACCRGTIGQGVGEYTPTVCTFHAKCMVHCGFHVKLIDGRVLDLNSWRSFDAEKRYRSLDSVGDQLREVNQEIAMIEKAPTLSLSDGKRLADLYWKRESLDSSLLLLFRAVS